MEAVQTQPQQTPRSRQTPPVSREEALRGQSGTLPSRESSASTTLSSSHSPHPHGHMHGGNSRTRNQRRHRRHHGNNRGSNSFRGRGKRSGGYHKYGKNNRHNVMNDTSPQMPQMQQNNQAVLPQQVSSGVTLPQGQALDPNMYLNYRYRGATVRGADGQLYVTQPVQAVQNQQAWINTVLPNALNQVIPNVRPNAIQFVRPVNVNQGTNPAGVNTMNPSLNPTVNPAVNPSVNPALRPYIQQHLLNNMNAQQGTNPILTLQNAQNDAALATHAAHTAPIVRPNPPQKQPQWAANAAFATPAIPSGPSNPRLSQSPQLTSPTNSNAHVKETATEIYPTRGAPPNKAVEMKRKDEETNAHGIKFRNGSDGLDMGGQIEVEIHLKSGFEPVVGIYLCGVPKPYPICVIRKQRAVPSEGYDVHIVRMDQIEKWRPLSDKKTKTNLELKTPNAELRERALQKNLRLRKEQANRINLSVPAVIQRCFNRLHRTTNGTVKWKDKSMVVRGSVIIEPDGKRASIDPSVPNDKQQSAQDTLTYVKTLLDSFWDEEEGKVSNPISIPIFVSDGSKVNSNMQSEKKDKMRQRGRGRNKAPIRDRSSRNKGKARGKGRGRAREDSRKTRDFEVWRNNSVPSADSKKDVSKGTKKS